MFMQHLKYYIPGSLLIFMAGFTAVFPEILVALVSVLIMMTGVFALYAGHSIRKSEIESRRMDDRFRIFSWHKYCFFK
jgi:hypothetical protein